MNKALGVMTRLRFVLRSMRQAWRDPIPASSGTALAESGGETNLSDDRLRATVNSMQEGFALLDADGHLVVVNDFYKRIHPESVKILETGGTLEDLIRANIARGLIPEAVGREEEFIRQRMEQHRNPKGPILRQYSDGNWFIIKESRTPEGGVAVTFTDITELRQTQDALRKSEALFRAVINHSPAKIHIKDLEGRYTLINKEAEKLFGVTDEEGRGKTSYDLFPKDVADTFARHDQTVIETGQPLESEEIFPMEDGDRTFLTVKFPIYDQNGITGVGAIGTDITERNLAQASRRAGEQTVRAIIDNLNDGIITINENGIVETFNPGAEKIFGYAKDEIVGRNVSVLMPGGERDNHDRYLENHFQNRITKIIGTGRELNALHKDGTEFPVFLSITEMKISEWSLDERRMTPRRRFIATVQNLTEKKQIEMVLRRSQKMEAVGKLSGGLAHDFNNLLSIVIGNLDFLTRMTQDDPKLLEPVLSALNAALRGGRLTDRMQGFSQQSRAAVEPTDVNTVLGGMSDIIAKSLTAEIKINFELADELWLSDIDSGELEDALLNLSLNARDAMPEGGTFTIRTRNITLDADYVRLNPDVKPGDYVEILATDSGTGIPPDILEKIFDPFFTTKDEGRGTGLGLSMVYGFAQRSKGYLNVTSEPDQGATFHLHLPRSREHAVAQPVGEISEALPGGNESILVVDDERDLAALTRNNLESLGYSVFVAHDAGEALDCLGRGNAIDLLFTDVVMPGERNGYDLAREATDLDPDLKVLLTSGFSRMPDGDEKLIKLFEDMVLKPYRHQDLAKKIRQTLDVTE